MIVTQNNKLNVIPGGIIPVVHVSQYDVDRAISFTLYDGNSAASLEEGTTATIEGTKPDGHGFQYSGTISGNVVTFNTTQQMTALAGGIECKLTLTNGSQVIGTAMFILEVEKAGLNEDTIISDTDIPLIISLATEQMERAEAAAVSANASKIASGSSALIAGNAAAICSSILPVVEHDAAVCASILPVVRGYKDDAEMSKIAAGSSMRIAGERAEDSEAWANGTRNGEPTTSDDPTYRKDARYWADQASQAAAGGVHQAAVAEVELYSVSRHAYNIGDQFWHNTILYTATQPIARDDEITPDIRPVPGTLKLLNDYSHILKVKINNIYYTQPSDVMSIVDNAVITLYAPSDTTYSWKFKTSNIGTNNACHFKVPSDAFIDRSLQNGKLYLVYDENDNSLTIQTLSSMGMSDGGWANKLTAQDFSTGEGTYTATVNCTESDSLTAQISSKVSGVKGNAESTYRHGDVNITPANIGLGNVNNTSDADKPVSTAQQTALNGKLGTSGDGKNVTVTYTSNDLAANTTEKISNTTNQPSTVAKLASGETLASMFNKVSSMFASIRKLWNTVKAYGTAAGKNFTTSVTSGSADLVTSGAVYSVFPFNYGTLLDQSQMTTSGVSAYQSRVTIQSGGYKIVGNYVYVNITLKANIEMNSSTWKILSNFPASYAKDFSILTGIVSTGESCCLCFPNEIGSIHTVPPRGISNGAIFTIGGIYRKA